MDKMSIVFCSLVIFTLGIGIGYQLDAKPPQKIDYEYSQVKLKIKEYDTSLKDIFERFGEPCDRLRLSSKEARYSHGSCIYADKGEIESKALKDIDHMEKLYFHTLHAIITERKLK